MAYESSRLHCRWLKEALQRCQSLSLASCLFQCLHPSFDQLLLHQMLSARYMAYESLCFRLPMAERGHLHICQSPLTRLLLLFQCLPPFLCSASPLPDVTSLSSWSMNFWSRCGPLECSLFHFDSHFIFLHSSSHSCIFPHRSSQLLATI